MSSNNPPPYDPRQQGGSPHAQRRLKFELTPEEVAMIQRERRKQLFSFQLPATAGSVFGTYYLMRNGVWKKSTMAGGRMPYFPKCFLAGTLTYGLCSFIGAYQTMKKLKSMGGNFSNFIDDAKGGFKNSEFSQETKNGPENINTILSNSQSNSEESQQQSSSMTYDELRRRNRVGSTTPSPPVSTPISEQPLYVEDNKPRPPPVYKPSGPEDLPAGGKNKYGDSWSKE